MIQENDRTILEVLQKKSIISTFLLSLGVKKKIEFTCDKCVLKQRCDFAYHLHNSCKGNSLLSRVGIDFF